LTITSVDDDAERHQLIKFQHF